MLRLEVTGRGPRRRAQRFMDIVKEDMKAAGQGEGNAKETGRRRHSIGSGESWREKPKGQDSSV